MSELYSNEDLINILEQSDIGYELVHGIKHERIADHKMRELWKAASESVRELDSYIEDCCEELE